jgi:hypothetical protein
MVQQLLRRVVERSSQCQLDRRPGILVLLPIQQLLVVPGTKFELTRRA